MSVNDGYDDLENVWDDTCPHCRDPLIKLGMIDIQAGFAEYSQCPKCGLVYRLSAQEIGIFPGQEVDIKALEGLLNVSAKKYRHH